MNVKIIIFATADGAPITVENLLDLFIFLSKKYNILLLNFISSFIKLWNEAGAQYSGLFMYNSVHWLSRGKVLKHFHLLGKARFILTEKGQECSELAALDLLTL